MDQGSHIFRNLAIVVASVVAVKFAFSEFLFRTSANDVIISTYQKTALMACERDSRGQKIVFGPKTWRKPSSVKLVIGKRDLDVYFWQVSHSMWNARYKNPYLFIVVRKSPNYMLCEYDIVHKSASVYRM